MNVVITVQAHPRRAEMAATLAAETVGMVVFDPEPHGARASPWRTYRHCLKSAPGYASGFATAGSATNVLVLQDDAQVCGRFPETFRNAVAARPDRVLVFFVAGNPIEHSRAVLQACQRDEPWAAIDTNRWCSAVATCWPVRHIHPMLRFVDAQRWPESFVADDEIIGRYLRHAGERPLASVPSLVQHPDMVPSLVGRKDRHGTDPGRVAACFADPGCDLTAIDWTRGPN